MKLLIAALLAAHFALAAVIGLGSASADVPTCPDSKSCVWTGENYNGERRVYDGSDQGTWDHLQGNNISQSAKNRFSNRRLLLAATCNNGPCGSFDPPGTHSCLNPGWEVANTSFWIGWVRVGAQGSRC